MFGQKLQRCVSMKVEKVMQFYAEKERTLSHVGGGLKRIEDLEPLKDFLRCWKRKQRAEIDSTKYSRTHYRSCANSPTSQDDTLAVKRSEFC